MPRANHRTRTYCPHCGILFSLPPELTGRVKFCSTNCMLADREKESRAQAIAALIARNRARLEEEGT
jgi:hypothetical protein